MKDELLSLAAELLPYGTKLKAGSKFINAAFKKGTVSRADRFLSSVELRYDYMSEKERTTFKKYIESKEGQQITTDFANAVHHTPSIIVNAALALLYCNDPEYSFTPDEVQRFVAAVEGLTDKKVDFLIELLKLKPIDQPSIFPNYAINQINYSSFHATVSLDEVFIYISDFQARGLLLNDTNIRTGMTFDSGITSVDNWYVKFGISDTCRKFISLLNCSALI